MVRDRKDEQLRASKSSETETKKIRQQLVEISRYLAQALRIAHTNPNTFEAYKLRSEALAQALRLAAGLRKSEQIIITTPPPIDSGWRNPDINYCKDLVGLIRQANSMMKNGQKEVTLEPDGVNELIKMILNLDGEKF